MISFIISALLAFIQPAYGAGEVFLVEPQNDSTYSALDYAEVQVNVPDTYDFVFRWGFESGSYLNSQVIETGGGTGNFGFSLDTPIMEDGTYYAIAELRDEAHNVLFSTGETTFHVDTSSTGGESEHYIDPGSENFASICRTNFAYDNGNLIEQTEVCYNPLSPLLVWIILPVVFFSVVIFMVKIFR